MKLNMRSVRKFLLTIVLLGLLGWPIAYEWAAHSEAFRSSQAFLEKSPELAKQIGPISSSYLKPFGFHITFGGGAGEAAFIISLKGSTTGEAHMRLENAGVEWKVTSAVLELLDGTQVQLTPK